MPNKLMYEQDQKSKLARLSRNQALGAGAADSGADSNDELLPVEAANNTQRNQLRAAIKSAANPRAIATDRLVSHTDQLIQQAQQLARKGDPASKEQAIQLFSQAVALSPADSDAWMWLGGMLLDQNLERAQYCLQRAVELNPQNERARRGLASVTAKLVTKITPPAVELPVPMFQDEPEVLAISVENQQTTALAIVPVEIEAATSEATSELSEVAVTDPNAQTQAELAIVPPEAENLALGEVQPDRHTRIGLGEAVAVLREAGYEADPATVPMGGAKIREGLASGALIAGKHGIREARLYGLRLTITLLGIMVLLAAVGIFLMIAQPDFKEMLSRTPPPTPVPTITPLPDQRAGTKLRASLANYNRYFLNFQNLTNQAINGKLEWQDFRRQFADLSSKIKTESQNVNAAAILVTPDLLETFKELQDVAATANTATDYTMSGIDHEQPEDLQAGMRYFGRATSMLNDAARKLEAVAPLPTPTEPILATVTSLTSSETGLLTPTPIQASTQTSVSITPAPTTPH